MNLTIFAGPDPEANLDALLKRTPLRLGPVCAVVPDSGSVAALERKLAVLSGNGFTGHRVYTMEGLALAILSQAGVAAEMIDPPVKRALAGELAASRIGRSSYYSTIAGYPGFINTILLYLADIRSTDKTFIRAREIEAVAAAYDVHLKRLRAADHEGVVMMALSDDRAERFSQGFGGPLIAHGFYDLTERQFQFISRLMAGFSRSAVSIPDDPSRPQLFDLPGKLRSRLEELGGRVVRVDSKKEGGTGVVVRGFRGGTWTGTVTPGDVQIHTFRSEEAEAGWIAGFIRDKIARGIWEHHDIMIVARSRPGYGTPLDIALRKNGIQVEGGVRRPLSTHPVVRVVLDAIQSSIHPDDDELAAGVLSSQYTGDRTRKTGTPAGPETDDRGWSCMLADIDSPEGFISSVKRMIEWLNIRNNLDGGGDPECALSEAAAFERLKELLDAFARFYSPLRKMVKVTELHRLLVLFLRDAFIIEQPCAGKGVLLADVNHARYATRRIVFLTGLDNRPFAGRQGGFSLHDPVYAREMLKHAESEDSLLFYLSMHGAEQLFLTFPGIDNEGGDPAVSPYLREIRGNTASWCLNAFHRGVPGAAWEGGYCDRRGRDEQIIRAMKANPELAPVILAGQRRRDQSAAARLELSLAVWSRMQKEPELILESPALLESVSREWGGGRVYSVSELEEYASCPVRFFLARILRLRVDRETIGEVEASDRGILIHEILARFYRRCISLGRAGFSRDELNDMKSLIREISGQVFAEKADAFAGLHPVVMLAEKKFLLAWMEYFLENEAEYFSSAPFRPFFLETGFGLESFSCATPYPPLRLEKGSDLVLVSGRIDRIDIDANETPPRIRIIDYKTGDCKASLSDLVSGKALQAPLYLKAATEQIVPGSSIHDGVFYNLREMAHVCYKAERKPVTGDDWAEYIRMACESAHTSVGRIRRGEYPPGECRDSRWCDFRLLCRGGREISGEESEYADS
ncbi:MAG: PD-(D/E)XK nuclease family protein [Candidatus Latescibacter sp.]|nr:PD-(D/E)XK nuclease family protein [Candidatus Latescibacter sp.]